MTDKEIKRADDMRVIIYGEPKVDVIRPKSGEHAGKDVSVLNLDVYKPNAEKLPDGTWKKKDSDFYKVQLYSEHAKDIAPVLAVGMALRVSGLIKEHDFTGKDGQLKHSRSILVDSIALDLLQKGIRAIDFEKAASKDKSFDRSSSDQALSKAPKPIEMDR